jgi:hypothetical protein
MKNLAFRAQIMNNKYTNISFQKYFDMKEDLAPPFPKVDFGSTFSKGGKITIYLRVQNTFYRRG